MGGLPKIRVTFCIFGDDLEINKIEKKLEIIPTSTRLKEDFPIKEIGTNEWVLATEAESCLAVEWQFEKILKLLRGKEEIINNICKEENAEANFTVTVFMEPGDGPELVLTEEIVSFLASINSWVGFDMYMEF